MSCGVIGRFLASDWHLKSLDLNVYAFVSVPLQSSFLLLPQHLCHRKSSF